MLENIGEISQLEKVHLNIKMEKYYKVILIQLVKEKEFLLLKMGLIGEETFMLGHYMEMELIILKKVIVLVQSLMNLIVLLTNKLIIY